MNGWQWCRVSGISVKSNFLGHLIVLQGLACADPGPLIVSSWKQRSSLHWCWSPQNSVRSDRSPDASGPPVGRHGIFTGCRKQKLCKCINCEKIWYFLLSMPPTSWVTWAGLFTAVGLRCIICKTKLGIALDHFSLLKCYMWPTNGPQHDLSVNFYFLMLLLLLLFFQSKLESNTSIRVLWTSYHCTQ